MIIYKPSIEDFLKEAFGIIYIQDYCKSGSNHISHYIAVSCFNKSNKVLWFCFSYATHLKIDTVAGKNAFKEGNRHIELIKEKIAKAGMMALPGIISEEVVEGELPNKIENADLNNFASKS